MAPVYPVRGIDSLKYFDGQTFYVERMEEINNFTDIVIRRKLYDMYGSIPNGIIFYDLSDPSAPHNSLEVTLNTNPLKIDIDYGTAYTSEYERIYVPNVTTSKPFPEFDLYSDAKYSGIPLFVRPARTALDRVSFGLATWVIGGTYVVWAGYKKELYRDVSSETQGVDFKEIEFDSYLFYISREDLDPYPSPTSELKVYENTLSYEPHWVKLATIVVSVGPTLTIYPIITSAEGVYRAPYAYFKGLIDEHSVIITPSYYSQDTHLSLGTLMDWVGDAPSTPGAPYLKNPFLVAPWNMGLHQFALFQNIHVKYQSALSRFAFRRCMPDTGAGVGQLIVTGAGRSTVGPLTHTESYVAADPSFFICWNYNTASFVRITVSTITFYGFSRYEIPMLYVDKAIGSTTCYYTTLNGVLDAKTYAQAKIYSSVVWSGGILPLGGTSGWQSFPTSTIGTPASITVEWFEPGPNVWSNRGCGDSIAGYYYEVNEGAVPQEILVTNMMVSGVTFRVIAVYRDTVSIIAPYVDDYEDDMYY